MTESPLSPAAPLTLRNLQMATRVLTAVFLASVGFGYFSALVQLHFNGGAKAGEFLPDGQDVVDHYHGKPPMSQLERLVVADEHRTFNGSGTMKPAFFTKSARWPQTVQARADKNKTDLATAEKELRKEREIEIDSIVLWIREGSQLDTYDKQPLPESMVKRTKDYPNTKFFPEDADGKIVANVKEIINVRCARCHYEGARGAEGELDLKDFAVVKDYATQPAEGTGAGMSLQKLAQSTHVHLLGFSMLYGLTGFIFSLTSYPSWMRVLFAPWPLIAQLADISCWWLARVDPIYAQAIRVTGGLVAIGLAVQILGSLFDLFDKKGKVVILLLVVLAAAGGGYVQQKVIGPHLASERARGVHIHNGAGESER